MNEQLIRYGADAARLQEASLYPDLSLSRVISQYNSIYRIADESGEHLAEASGRMLHLASASCELPAVGDFVMTSRGEGCVIRAVLPRRSVFERRAAGGDSVQVVAANIDIVFVCMALNSDYNLSRLERYLAVAWSSGAVPVAVLTKADLCDDVAAYTAQAMQCAAGADVMAVSSAQDPASYLLPYLKPGVTASFIGSSGVGKSTLINALLGGERLRVSDIRADGKGRHTTTRRELFVLEGGGIVIDTPGMRELGVQSVSLSDTFDDIDALAAQCRFRDCSHISEPGCAVRRAIEDGTLEQRRLNNYQKLQREAVYDGLDHRRLENEKLSMMFKDVGGMKNVRKFNRENDKRRR